MTRINTNVASLRGLRNLQSASDQLNTSLTRLSTGLKINSGKDNPSGLIAGETLRLQVTAIEQSIKNSNRANNVIATADGALGEIGGLLNQVRGLVQEGLNSGALSQTELDANQLQIDAALNAINRIATNTTFAGDKLIDGSKAFTTNVSAADAAELNDFQVNELLFGSNSSINVAATINSAATKGTLTYGGGAPTADTTLEVGGSKGSEVLFFGDKSTIADISSAVNAVSDSTGVEASVTTAAVNGTLNLAAGAVDDVLTFTDQRAINETTTIDIVAAGNNTAFSIDVTTPDGGPNTITVNLATDGAGAVTSSTLDIQNGILNNSAANDLVSVAGGTAELAVDVGPGNVGDTVARVLGEITFTSSDFGSQEFVDINVLNGAFATLDVDSNTVGRDAGSDVAATINGQKAQGNGLKASVKTAMLDASVTFGSGASVNVAGTTSTVTVTGGGSLFQIGQDVSPAGQIGIGIEAVNTARLGGVSGKLFELGSNGGKSLLDVGPSVQGADLVAIVEEALNKVSTLRGRLGAVQKNVIETNITSLGVALENITEARSQIVDTDFAVETANLTRAQILSQSGISVLGIANQNPAQVLSLLG